MQREVNEYAKSLAQRGIQPQADWLANGDLDKNEEQIVWTEQNSRLFE